MHTKLKCPPLNVLAELIEGQLVEPQLSELSAHLEECPACQAHVKTVPPSDLLIESLRGEAPAEDQIARDAPRPLIEKLKQISRRPASAAAGVHDDTPGAGDETLISASGQRFDFLAPAEQADELGRLGHYRVLKVLGQGGMGVVFLADDSKLQRLVALKVMLPSVVSIPLAKERFLREARATARLKSDHIVTIHEVSEARGIPYLAMELLEGKSLATVLRAGKPLSTEAILPIARDIARGLAAAHEAGLVHRDIKPGNLWLEDRAQGSRVKILDFGLARPDVSDDHFTQLGTSVGTPAFMSPEQARGDTAVDARADLFSLGCVLYTLCVGEIPFKAETNMGTLLAISLQQPVAPRERNPAIPSALSALVMQLLAKDPASRPSSAPDVLRRLDDVERSLSVSAPPRRSAHKWPPRGVLLVGLMILALVVFAATTFFWRLPDGRIVSIECADPAIKLAFEDGELKVAGAYKEPLTVRPGKVGLRITRGDDFEFETDKLVVNKGDKVALRIDVTEGQVQIVQAGKGVLDSKRLPLSPSESWAQAVARMAAKDQVAAVARKLKELNPNFNEASLSHKIEDGVVVWLDVGDASALTDLSPIRALTGLKDVHLHGRFVGAADIGPLRGLQLTSFQSDGCPHQDLSPLQGMPLTKATFWGLATTNLSPLRGMKLVQTNLGNCNIKDISVLTGMPLENVCLNHSQVDDLAPLGGAPLRKLEAANIKAKDLRPLANAPLEFLSINGTPIEDLSPLLTMPLVELYIDEPLKHAELLRKIPTLKMINQKPVAEVRRNP